jgi:hypothetical protein
VPGSVADFVPPCRGPREGSSSEWIETAPAQPSAVRQSPAASGAARRNDEISDRTKAKESQKLIWKFAKSNRSELLTIGKLFQSLWTVIVEQH